MAARPETVGVGAAAVAIYVCDILRIYRERRRKAVELNRNFFIFLPLSLI